MNNQSVSTSFVSEKISKIRFCPEQFSDASTFVTGSYGNTKENSVKFWKILKNDIMEDDNEYIPKTVAQLPYKGDITALEFLDFNNLAASCSDGSLNLIYINRDRDADNLKNNFTFEGLHRFSCSDISTLDDEYLATSGEDGTYNIVSVVSRKVVRSNKKADSTAISCCSFVSQRELLTGNNMGVIKVFDISGTSEKPSSSLSVSCEDDKRCNRVSSICFHPTQIHIILAGTEEGSITVFDLRNPSTPASYLSAHSEAINEIGFHRSEPSKMFTCAENGDLWQWHQNTFPNIDGFRSVAADTEVPWLNGERAKNNITVTALVNGNRMGINSFDSFKNKVVAAGDNEAVYLVEQLY